MKEGFDKLRFLIGIYLSKTFEDICNSWTSDWTRYNYVDKALVSLTCGYTEEEALKARCIEWNLDLLETPSFGSQQGEDCIWGVSEPYRKIQKCDCSDPENYDYFDEGRF